jgi:hypothetical protein
LDEPGRCNATRCALAFARLCMGEILTAIFVGGLQQIPEPAACSMFALQQTCD